MYNKAKYRLRQTISHSSLLVAHQGDVSRKLNQAFLLVDSLTPIFIVEERSNIYMDYVDAMQDCLGIADRRAMLF